MTKIKRLTIVLSIVWLVVAYPSFYLYGIKLANESSNVFLNYCTSMQSLYPKDEHYLDRCEKTRNELYINGVEDIHIQSSALTIVLLLAFIVIGFLIRKAYAWIKSGT